MIFDWYKIINRSEFSATGLVSRELQLILEGVGLRTILVTQGKLLSVVYEGVMLSVGVTDSNPFVFEGLAIYIDENQDVWLGIQVPQ
jgi:hypothetical protein